MTERDKNVYDNIEIRKHNGRIRNTRWAEFTKYLKEEIYKIHYKLLHFFIDVENKKEYNPENLGTHNKKMRIDSLYKFSFYSKRMMYKIRYKLINFLVDVIITMILLSFLLVLMVVVGTITYFAMVVLIFLR